MYNWKDKSSAQKVKIVLANQNRMSSRRRLFEDLWQLIIKIFRPRRYDILGLNSKGEQFGAQVFDQGPSNALAKFSSGRIGYMVNRSVPWIQFVSTDKHLMEFDHIKEYMQNAAEQVLFAAGRSTFYSSVVPHALDADSIGTSCMVPLIDEKNDRIVFDTVHPRDTYIAVDMFGDVNVYHRTPLKLTRTSAEEMFGVEALPDNWYEEGQLKQPMQEDTYLWAVYPNDDRQIGSLAQEDKEFKMLVLLMGETSLQDSILVYERGRDYFPICYRTGRDSGCEYGTSVSADCLTAALVTNKLAEKSIDAAHKAVEPPKIASKSIRSTLETDAGSTTWVDDIQRDGVKTWMDKLNWPITDAQMNRLDAQIQDRMFIRFFEMLSAGDIKVRTAFEVSQMMAEKATLMSTIVDTFEQESLIPAIEILILEETRAGRMPPPPEEIIVSGGNIDINFLGPLAQLQRSLLRSKGTIDALQIIEQMMGMNEQVAWKFDWLGMAEDVAIAQGMPQKHVLSDAEVDLIRQQNAEQQQLEQQIALLEATGSAAPGLSQAPQEGSPAAVAQEELEAA